MDTPDPKEEDGRLAALEATGLYFSPAEERFDRITRLASHLLETPIALVTLVGDTHQWFKSAQGLAANETPREVAFCAHAIAAGDGLVVEDALQDTRFARNPLVTGEPHVRAYAGTVIRAPGGQPLGTLCVIDSKPRRFSREELASLSDLAAIAEAEVARGTASIQADYLRRLGARARRERIDPQSRLLGHDAAVELLMQLAERPGARFSTVLVRVPQVAGLASRFGNDCIAVAMAAVASTLLRTLPEEGVAARFGEDTFIVVAPGAGESEAALHATRIREAIAAKPVQAGAISVRLTATTATRTASHGDNLAALLEAAASELGVRLGATSR